MLDLIINHSLHSNPLGTQYYKVFQYIFFSYFITDNIWLAPFLVIKVIQEIEQSCHVFSYFGKIILLQTYFEIKQNKLGLSSG